MDSTELSIDSQDRSDLENVLLIGGSAMLLAGLFSLWNRKKGHGSSELLQRKRRRFGVPDDPTDPPPIIIKSGSFVIESDQALRKDAANPTHYRRNNFNRIKGIRIITMDGTVDEFEEIVDWEIADGVKVEITLNICQQEPTSGDCQAWGPNKIINVFNDGNHFKLEAPITLSNDKSKRHKKRKFMREDEENKLIQFGRVKITKRTTGVIIANYPETDGREYIIQFYDRLS